MAINDIIWERLTSEQKKAFPPCVKPPSLRGPCLNRLPNDRCGNQCECARTAKEWGLRRDVLMFVKDIKRQVEILEKLMGVEND